MKGDRKAIADSTAAPNEITLPDEVIITDYFVNDMRIYKLDTTNPENPKSTRSYAFMACHPATFRIKSLVGRMAIVCLESGQIVLREIYKSEKRGRFDLHNYFRGPSPIITCDVQPRWAAALACGMPSDTWEEMMGEGRVKILRDLHSPEGAGRA